MIEKEKNNQKDKGLPDFAAGICFFFRSTLTYFKKKKIYLLALKNITINLKKEATPYSLVKFVGQPSKPVNWQ